MCAVVDIANTVLDSPQGDAHSCIQVTYVCQCHLCHTLTCVMGCPAHQHSPFPLPAREHLERLLNDATFTEELLSFSSVSDLYIVKPEHQAELIPVLIRLLYGRMQRLGHPRPAAQRRGAVLRFLEACRGGEVQEFIHLISAPFEQVTLSVGSRKEIVPLKKQQG